jgi:hypothetical protein
LDEQTVFLKNTRFDTFGDFDFLLNDFLGQITSLSVKRHSVKWLFCQMVQIFLFKYLQAKHFRLNNQSVEWHHSISMVLQQCPVQWFKVKLTRTQKFYWILINYVPVNFLRILYEGNLKRIQLWSSWFQTHFNFGIHTHPSKG